MKKVLLLGDSIRMGYDKYVAEQLAGEAEVLFPSENCRFAEYILRSLGDWREKLGIDTLDAVHWNVGLWDTLRLTGDDGTLTRPEVYADYICRIQKRLMYYSPDAKYIFATSTPVWEEKFDPAKAVRYNRDIEQFNRIARDVLADFPVEINDLYALMCDQPKSLYSDMTHFYTPEGTKRLGDCVTQVLRTALDMGSVK